MLLLHYCRVNPASAVCFRREVQQTVPVLSASIYSTGSIQVLLSFVLPLTRPESSRRRSAHRRGTYQHHSIIIAVAKNTTRGPWSLSIKVSRYGLPFTIIVYCLQCLAFPFISPSPLYTPCFLKGSLCTPDVSVRAMCPCYLIRRDVLRPRQSLTVGLGLLPRLPIFHRFANLRHPSISVPLLILLYSLR